MSFEQPTRPLDQAIDALVHVRRFADWEEPADQEEQVTRLPTYRVKLGREPIWLNTIEFRIFSFLATRPYRACTRQRIAAAISTEGDPVPEASLDRHIASLRYQLGYFGDYIQSVPYIGYRFKP